MSGLRAYEFGSFRLIPDENLLLRDSEPVPLPPKVFEVLVCLVENEGHLVRKQDLVDRLWPDSFVEEGTLARTVSSLRKGLGETKDEKFIQTIPKRGYRFTAAVRRIADENTATGFLPKTNDLNGRMDGKFDATPDASHFSIQSVLSRPLLLIALLAVSGVIVSLIIAWSRQADQPKEVTSLAVLPFHQIGEERADEMLEFGMADTLITRLSALKQVVVRPASSVAKYTGQQPDALAIGRELQADAVLEGSIQRSGTSVRVNVHLIRTADGASLWAEQFDMPVLDVFALQDSICSKIVRPLSIQLTSSEQKYLAKRWTENPEAFRLYVTGRYLWNKRDATERAKAIDYFSQAISMDSNYALAYAGLADCYLLGGHGAGASPSELMTKAREAATRALDIEPSLAEARTSLSLVSLVYDWDFQTADAGFTEAIELNPNYAVAHHWYAESLTLAGRTDDALAEIKRARELDPSSLIIMRDLGRLYYFDGQTDLAIEKYGEILGTEPDFFPAVYYRALAYLRKGMLAEAVNESERADGLARGSALTKSLLVNVYAKAGNMEKANEVLTALQQSAQVKRVPPFDLATAYMGLKQYDHVFELLQRSCDERAYRMIYMKVDPLYEDLRSDPRYESLLRCIGV